MIRITAISFIAAAAATSPVETPRDIYQSGVVRLQANKLSEAEEAFLDAARTNHKTIQPLATYNLGHVRFLQGKEMLAGQGNRQQILDGGKAASAVAEEVLQSGKKTLRENPQVEALVQAYNDARAARKELRLSRDQTTRALNLLGSTLALWRKSANSFYSAHELDAANEDAKFNADVVEKHIAEQLKFEQQMQQQAAEIAEKRKELSEMMKEMRGKIPKDRQRESGDEEDEDDEPGDEREQKQGAGQQQQQRLGTGSEMDKEMMKLLKEKIPSRFMQPGGEREFEPRRGRDW